jgi:hypothetical protein
VREAPAGYGTSSTEEGSTVERAISTLVDTAAEQARQAAKQAGTQTAKLGGSVREHATDLASETVRRAGEVAEALSPSAIPVAAVKAKARRGKAAKRRTPTASGSGGGRRVLLMLLVAVGAGAVVAIVVRRRRASSDATSASPAPDAFGAAVEAEHDAMSGNGSRRPVATPGA